jgi:hypothetical protein
MISSFKSYGVVECGDCESRSLCVLMPQKMFDQLNWAILAGGL